MTRLKATFDGKVLVPVGPADLQAGHLYEVDIRDTEIGSPQSLLLALQSLPKIPREWIDEMEEQIRRGEKPARYESLFKDE